MEHQCEICDKVVLTIGALVKHRRVHTDGRKNTGAPDLGATERIQSESKQLSGPSSANTSSDGEKCELTMTRSSLVVEQRSSSLVVEQRSSCLVVEQRSSSLVV